VPHPTFAIPGWETHGITSIYTTMQ